MVNFVQDYLAELRATLAELDTEALARGIEWMREAGRTGQMIVSCGNGGSASIASHLVNDLVKGATQASGLRFKAIALTDNVATLSAVANDLSYDDVFAEPLRNFAREGDILVAISASGNSRNVLRATECAHSLGCKTIGLTRRDGGRLREVVQLALTAPSDHTGRLEDAFAVMAHLLTYPFMDQATSAT